MQIIVRFFLLLLLLSNLGGELLGQELNCNVSVSGARLEGSYRDVVNSMQDKISTFMNSRQWGSVDYGKNKIECNLFIDIQSIESSENFTGSIHIQVTRPVYNSVYKSTLLNLKEGGLEFTFKEFEPLLFSSNSSMESLPAILSYYAYMIVGYDLDSYSLYGGDVLFKKAQSLVLSMQGGSFSGWAGGSRGESRSVLVESLLNDSYKMSREALYIYYIEGLDIMSHSPEKGEEVVLNAVSMFSKLNTQRKNLYLMKIFFDAHGDEIVTMFIDNKDHSEIVEILSECSPYSAMKLKEGIVN